MMERCGFLAKLEDGGLQHYYVDRITSPARSLW
jgi:hypothetical protein